MKYNIEGFEVVVTTEVVENGVFVELSLEGRTASAMLLGHNYTKDMIVSRVISLFNEVGFCIEIDSDEQTETVKHIAFDMLMVYVWYPFVG